jgi:hypothetical protein
MGAIAFFQDAQFRFRPDRLDIFVQDFRNVRSH